MAKFHGIVGYVLTEETSPGVFTESDPPIEKTYFGDVIRMTSKTMSGESVNDNFTINHRISIVADPFAYENFCYIRYVNWMGTLWKVSSVEVQRPRLILAVGGVYNG